MQPNLLRTFFLFAFIITGLNLFAQDYLPYSARNAAKNGQNNQLYRNLEISAGYVPGSSDDRLKANLGINNLLVHRIGAYTSFEYGLQNNQFINITGGTISVQRFVYVWGGMDLFSKNGLMQSGFKGSRKEAGIGITPYKFMVARAGWSTSVGFSLAVGIRIPI